MFILRIILGTAFLSGMAVAQNPILFQNQGPACDLFVDGEKVGSMDAGDGLLRTQVYSGQHIVQCKATDPSVRYSKTLEVEPGPQRIVAIFPKAVVVVTNPSKFPCDLKLDGKALRAVEPNTPEIPLNLISDTEHDLACVSRIADSFRFSRHLVATPGRSNFEVSLVLTREVALQVGAYAVANSDPDHFARAVVDIGGTLIYSQCEGGGVMNWRPGFRLPLPARFANDLVLVAQITGCVKNASGTWDGYMNSVYLESVYDKAGNRIYPQ